MEDFDSLAKGWDTENRIERAKAIASEISRHIAGENNKTAMEYGCGTGLVGLQLIECFSSLIFIDSSIGMIEELEHKLRVLNTKTASTMCCDIMVEIPNGLKLDYIFSSLVLHHVLDTETILFRLKSLLNKGGHLLIVDLDEDDGSFHAKYPDFEGHNGFKQASLRSLAEKVGFVNVKASTFYHGYKVIDGKQIQYSLFILDAEI